MIVWLPSDGTDVRLRFGNMGRMSSVCTIGRRESKNTESRNPEDVTMLYLPAWDTKCSRQHAVMASNGCVGQLEGRVLSTTGPVCVVSKDKTESYRLGQRFAVNLLTDTIRVSNHRIRFTPIVNTTDEWQLLLESQLNELETALMQAIGEMIFGDRLDPNPSDLLVLTRLQLPKLGSPRRLVFEAVREALLRKFAPEAYKD